MPETTWSDGDVATAAKLNQIEDQIIVTCTSSTRPTGVEGRGVYETDTGRYRVYDGTSWNVSGGSGWETFSPSWSGVSIGNGTNEGAYHYVAGGLWVRASFVLGSTSSVTGPVTLTLPDSAAIEQSVALLFFPFGTATLREDASKTSVGLVIYNNLTSVTVQHVDPATTSSDINAITSSLPFTWGTSDRIVVDFTVPV